MSSSSSSSRSSSHRCSGQGRKSLVIRVPTAEQTLEMTLTRSYLDQLQQSDSYRHTEAGGSDGEELTELDDDDCQSDGSCGASSQQQQQQQQQQQGQKRRAPRAKSVANGSSRIPFRAKAQQRARTAKPTGAAAVAGSSSPGLVGSRLLLQWSSCNSSSISGTEASAGAAAVSVNSVLPAPGYFLLAPRLGERGLLEWRRRLMRQQQQQQQQQHLSLRDTQLDMTNGLHVTGECFYPTGATAAAAAESTELRPPKDPSRAPQPPPPPLPLQSLPASKKLPHYHHHHQHHHQQQQPRHCQSSLSQGGTTVLAPPEFQQPAFANSHCIGWPAARPGRRVMSSSSRPSTGVDFARQQQRPTTAQAQALSEAARKRPPPHHQQQQNGAAAAATPRSQYSNHHHSHSHGNNNQSSNNNSRPRFSPYAPPLSSSIPISSRRCQRVRHATVSTDADITDPRIYPTEQSSSRGQREAQAAAMSRSYDGTFFSGQHRGHGRRGEFVIHPEWMSETVSIERLRICDRPLIMPAGQHHHQQQHQHQQHMAASLPSNWPRRCKSAPPPPQVQHPQHQHQHQQNPITWQ